MRSLYRVTEGARRGSRSFCALFLGCGLMRAGAVTIIRVGSFILIVLSHHSTPKRERARSDLRRRSLRLSGSFCLYPLGGIGRNADPRRELSEYLENIKRLNYSLYNFMLYQLHTLSSTYFINYIIYKLSP